MSQLNPKLEAGDRIVLLHMEDNFGPKIGTFGTVIARQEVPYHLGRGYNYLMKWDDGNMLSLDPDDDTWILKSDYDKKKKKVEESYEVYETLYEEYKKRGVI
jgi:hypothetical protein